MILQIIILDGFIETFYPLYECEAMRSLFGIGVSSSSPDAIE